MRAFFPTGQRSQRAALFWARRLLAVIGALIVVAAGALAAQAAMLMLASPRILVSRALPAPVAAEAAPGGADPATFASPAIRAAKAGALDTVDGLEMLVGQAALAFELFFGAAPPREHDEELRERLLA